MEDSIVADLKRKYGRVFLVSEGGKDYVFRCLRIYEFQKVINDFEVDAEAEDFIVENTLVWPTDCRPLNSLRPGTVTTVANDILDESAFTNPKKARAIFEAERDHALEAIEIMRAVVLACGDVLGVQEQDINRYTFDQLAKKTALAEQIIQIRKSIVDPTLELHLEIIDPEELIEADRAEQDRALKESLSPRNEEGRSKFGTATVNDPIARNLQDALRRAAHSGAFPFPVNV